MLADHGHDCRRGLAQAFLSFDQRSGMNKSKQNTHGAKHKITKTGECLSLWGILSSRRG
jgi:hypothetical protein